MFSQHNEKINIISNDCSDKVYRMESYVVF